MSTELSVLTPSEAAQIQIPSELSPNVAALGCLAFVGVVIGLPSLFGGWALGAIIGLGLAGAGILRIAASPQSQAAKAFRAGVQAYQAGQYGGALDAFEKADQALPLPATKIAMARTLVAAGRIDDAITRCRLAIKTDSSNPLWRFRLADILVEAERFGDAAEVYSELPSELRRDLPVLVNHASCYMGMERYDLALALLETGPMLKRSMDSMMVKYRYLLGRCYEEMGARDKAISQLTRVVAEDGSFLDAANRLESLRAVKEAKRRRKAGPASS